jgi:hypothetical protein
MAGHGFLAHSERSFATSTLFVWCGDDGIQFVTLKDKEPASRAFSIKENDNEVVEALSEFSIHRELVGPVNCLDLNAFRTRAVDNDDIPTLLSFTMGEVCLDVSLEEFPQDKVFADRSGD